MKQEMDTFEQELRELAPIRPPVNLKERIASEIANGDRGMACRRGWLAGLFAVAACLVVLAMVTRSVTTDDDMVVQRTEPPTQQTPPVMAVQRPGRASRYETVLMSNVLLDRQWGELTSIGSGPPMRPVRMKIFDRMRWRIPGSSETIELQRVRQQTILTQADML